MNAVFEKLSELHGAALKFLTVDVEKCEDLPEKYAVTAVPTFLLLKPDGTVLSRVDGADAAKLTTMVQSAAKDVPNSIPATSSTNTAAKAATATSAASQELSADVRKRLDALVTQAPIVLFMKGSPEAPRCGFSSKAVALLKKHDAKFAHVDVLVDNEARVSMKAYANWPTFPQLWVQGKLIGGLDVCTEMDADGELAPLLRAPSATESLETRLRGLIESAPVMLFMKGSPDAPRCGFSSKMVKLLNDNKVDFKSFDILTDERVREGLKEYSKWPTYPQLYAHGKLIGGLDVVAELVAENELEASLKKQ